MASWIYWYGRRISPSSYCNLFAIYTCAFFRTRKKFALVHTCACGKDVSSLKKGKDVSDFSVPLDYSCSDFNILYLIFFSEQTFFIYWWLSIDLCFCRSIMQELLERRGASMTQKFFVKRLVNHSMQGFHLKRVIPFYFLYRKCKKIACHFH